MDSARLLKAELIFHDLVEHDLAQRPSLVAHHCAGDPELRHLVERLLSNDDSGMDGFLRLPAFKSDSDAHSRAAAIPQQIGKYEIVSVLGEGGMGVVYEARQQNPSRTVALKVIRTALPSRETFRRFRHEAEILGQLQHPGIAHVYEAGVASVGPADGLKAELPYFAMELVRGKPLREFAEDRRLSVRDRLGLMAQVCDAVQHAHEKGVIHRDLKADNLLVEDSGQARILDFGVARLITPVGDSTDTRHTRAGEIIGTLAYMSPEQVAGDQALVDTRSDVYSLGVILYELLSGSLPHEVRGLPLTEAAHRIRNVDPPPVSSLVRGLRGDIETIVAKAMHNERARRYESAAALAADLRRFLRLEPIAARSNSAVYVLGKTLRRYRWPVAASIAFVIGLSAFSAYAWIQSQSQRQLTMLEHAARQRAEAASDDARRAEQSERAQRGVAEAAAEKAVAAERAQAGERLRAEREAQRARSVTTFLVDTLGLADPDLAQSADMSMKTALDRAAGQVGGRFADQPESEARVRLVIGRAYATLGELDPAEEHLRRAVEIREGELDSGPEVLYEALWPHIHVLDELGHPDYRNRWWRLYRLYPKLFLRVSSELAAVQFELRAQLGEKYEPQKGEALYAEFRRIAAETLKPDDPFWMVVADFLHMGGANLALKQLPEVGRAYLRDAIQIERRWLPETNTRIIRTLGELVRASLDAGMHAEAEALTRESLALIRKTLPEDHWYMAVNRARLGACLSGQGRFEDGERLLLDNLGQIEATLGTTNAPAREIVERLIDVYDTAGKPAAAEHWRDSLARRIVGSRQDHRPIRQVQRVLGPRNADLFETLNRFNDEKLSRAGVEAMNELLPLRRERFPDDDVRSALIAECLCFVASAAGDARGVNRNKLELLTEAERVARAGDYLHPAKRAWIYWNFGRNLEAQRRYAEAERQARDAIAILDRELGAHDPLTVEVRSLLGGSLAGQECFDEAESLLLAAFERQAPAGGVDYKPAHDTLLRLIRLYQATGRPRDAFPYAHAIARARWLDWNDVKPVIAPEFPALADALDALRAVPLDDVDSIWPAVRRVIAERTAAFGPHEPVALVYAGALYRIVRRDLQLSHHPVWIPALEEIRDTALCHLPADEADVGSIFWWLAATNARRGEYVKAEAAARESLRIALVYDPDPAAGVPDRDSLVAGALIGQGRFAEGQPMLLAAFDSQFGRDVPRQPYAAECFGNMVNLYAGKRSEEALQRIKSVLRIEIDRRRNPTLLYQFSHHILAHTGLPAELYELAREAAQIASDARQNVPHSHVLVAAADCRLGRFDAALGELERLDSLPSGDFLIRASFLAITRHRLGRIESAREAFQQTRKQLENRADAITVQERLVLAETERLIDAD